MRHARDLTLTPELLTRSMNPTVFSRGALVLLMGAVVPVLWADPAPVSEQTNIGGVNVIVAETEVSERITVIEGENAEGYHVHRVPSIVTGVYSMSVSGVEVKLQTGGRVAVAVQVRPVLTAWYRAADGSRVTHKQAVGDFVNVNNGHDAIQVAPLEFVVESGLGVPKLSVDVEFHFKGQVKDISVDANTLKILTDHIAREAPVFGGFFDGIPDVYQVPDDPEAPVITKFNHAKAVLLRQ
jgi:hypothetical protein